jgi:hypothetical protein
MAIRFTINHVCYEVDTVEEAAQLQQALTRKNAARKAAETRWSTTPATPEGSPKNDKVHPIAAALRTLAPNTVSHDALASMVGVSKASLIPMWGHFRKWVEEASGKQLKYEDVLKKEPNPNGGGSLFKLSKVGIELVDRVSRD